MSAEIIELAKDGVKIHQPKNPEYIVCAEPKATGESK